VVGAWLGWGQLSSAAQPSVDQRSIGVLARCLAAHVCSKQPQGEGMHGEHVHTQGAWGLRIVLYVFVLSSQDSA